MPHLTSNPLQTTFAYLAINVICLVVNITYFAINHLYLQINITYSGINITHFKTVII